MKLLYMPVCQCGSVFPELVWLIWLAAASGGSTMAEAFSIYAKYSDHQSHLGVPLITGRRSRPTPPNSYHNITSPHLHLQKFRSTAKAIGLSEEWPRNLLTSNLAMGDLTRSDPGPPFVGTNRTSTVHERTATSNGTSNLHPFSYRYASC